MKTQIGIILGLSLSLIAAAHAGPGEGGGSGGGNVCYLANGPRVLDVIKDGFVPALSSHVSGLQIPVTRAEFLPFNPMQGVLAARVNELVQPLRSRYPELEKYLASGIDGLGFIAIKKSFSTSIGAAFTSPQLCNDSNVRAVIGLIGGIKFVSIPDWNQLDLETQAQLIVHEGWRFAQKVLGLHIDNHVLQDLTYATVVDLNHFNNVANLSRLHLENLGSFKSEDFCKDLRDLLTGDTRTLPPELFIAQRTGCKTPLELDSDLVREANFAVLEYGERAKRVEELDLARKVLDINNKYLNKIRVRASDNIVPRFAVALVRISYSMAESQLLSKNRNREMEREFQKLLQGLPISVKTRN